MPAYSYKVLDFKFLPDNLTLTMKSSFMSMLGSGLVLLPLVAAGDVCQDKTFYVDQVGLSVNPQTLARILINTDSAPGSSEAVPSLIILATTIRRPCATLEVCVLFFMID